MKKILLNIEKLIIVFYCVIIIGDFLFSASSSIGGFVFYLLWWPIFYTNIIFAIFYHIILFTIPILSFYINGKKYIIINMITLLVLLFHLGLHLYFILSFQGV
jgi:hypothetical protein